MSWAANNVEAHEEICIKGVTAKLMAALSDYGYDNVRYEDARAIVETISNEVNDLPVSNHQRSAWIPLVEWAAKEISDEESSYFTRGI